MQAETCEKFYCYFLSFNLGALSENSDKRETERDMQGRAHDIIARPDRLKEVTTKWKKTDMKQTETQFGLWQRFRTG